MMSDETFINKAVTYSHEVILKEGSRELVDGKHEFVCFRMINEHHHFKSEVFVVSELGEWECSTH